MDHELKETVLKTADYTNNETVRYTKKIFWFLATGIICWSVSQIISHTSLVESSLMSIISDFTMGLSCGMMISGIIITSRYGQRIRAFKQRLLKIK